MTNKAIITNEISDCEKCTYSHTERVYTADSFENVRKVYCKKLFKDVHTYLDWNEKAKIPNECPYVVEN
jgi:hypothetical protein